MVTEPLPDVNAPQLQMLKYMKRPSSDISDNGFSANTTGSRERRESSRRFRFDKNQVYSLNRGRGHLHHPAVIINSQARVLLEFNKGKFPPTQGSRCMGPMILESCGGTSWLCTHIIGCKSVFSSPPSPSKVWRERFKAAMGGHIGNTRN